MLLLRRLCFSTSTYRNANMNANMNATKAKVLNEIQTKPVVIFSKSRCPHSLNTKTVITSLGLKPGKVTYLELDKMGDEGKAMQAALAEGFDEKTPGINYDKPYQTTVPNIFIGGKHIVGGNEGLVEKVKNEPEELQQWLRDAGAL